ncbi:hypothetical protein YC2023_082813 [Brassica napus]
MEDPLMVQILPDHHRRSRWYTFTKPKSKSILLLIITITLGLLFVCYSNIELSSSRWNLTPGLSAYSDNPAADLVYFAKAFIPVGVLKVTDISQADGYCWYETVQEHILQVSRKVLRSSGFTFLDEWASVISGSDEGIYAWVIANYALGSLGGDPLQTTGIVELGGASALCTGLTFSRPFLFVFIGKCSCVAFVSSEVVPPEFSRTISYVGVAYKIYSHSFLHYGQVKFFEEQRESICLLSLLRRTQHRKIYMNHSRTQLVKCTFEFSHLHRTPKLTTIKRTFYH